MNGSTALIDRQVPTYYARQLRLPEIGLSGQRRLAEARVAVIGLGALGCPAATYLVRAGVGEVRLIDGDVVDESNLHRQTLYGPADIGASKAAVAASALKRGNPNVLLTSASSYFPTGDDVDEDSDVLQLLSDADLILDCTDRFSSRFAVHDFCQLRRVSLVSSAVGGFTGQLRAFPFADAGGPCLRCLYPETPSDGCTGSCAVDGILGAAAGVMGSLQALTGLRMVLDLSGPPAGVTYTIDLASLRIHEMRFDRDPDCPCCGAGPSTDDAGWAGASKQERPAYAEVHEEDPGSETRGTRIFDLRDEGEVRPDDRLLLPTAELLPLDELYGRLDTLDPEEAYILVCEHGSRSARALEEMRAAGIAHVRHLAGGYARLRSSLCFR